MRTVLAIPLGLSADHLLASRRTRELAALLGLDPGAQARLAGAVAQVVESGLAPGSEGVLEFALEEAPGQRAVGLTVAGVDPAAFVPSAAGTRLDLDALRALVDRVEARENGATAVVRLTFRLDEHTFIPSTADVTRALQSEPASMHVASVEELRRRNGELVRTLATLQQREQELLDLNRRLEDTNEGVLALLAEVDRTAAELRRQAASKTRFLRTMSHDLRTPLYAARGLLEELAASPALGETDRGDIALLDGTVQEALTLVNDQLDLARLEEGRAVVRAEPIEIATLFQQLRGTLRVLVRNDAVELRFTAASPGLVIESDPARLARLLRNLVGNALKFTTAGHVEVTASAADGGRAIAFAVADTGVGIAPEDLDTIFEEFGQATAGQDHGLESSGLGLPIARRIAELLGGTLTVESVLGAGSTFTATIPTRVGVGAAADGTAARDAVSGEA